MTIRNHKTGLEKNKANYVPLSPVTFLKRTADIFPNYTSIISENNKFTWKSTFTRCKLFASSLKKRKIKKGDTVSIIAPNSSAMYEAHFAIPMIGAVINTINIRLDAKTVSFILTHSDSKIIFSDTEFLPIVKEALKISRQKIPIIFIEDDLNFSKNIKGDQSYEDFLNEGNLEDYKFDLIIEDEWFPISLSYTSGTTGNPKGVVTHHRGAYLNSISNHLIWNMKKNPVYLWTLPMFHCNGWCFPWTIAALSGTNICLRKIDSKEIFRLIKKYNVSNLCGTAVIINMLISEGTKLDHRVEFMTGAAPPPVSVLKKIEEQGFNITHTYGLTEVYGPAVVCEWQKEWDNENADTVAELKSRQGVKCHGISDLQVINKKTKKPVAKNGKELGEVYMRGNTVMMGYYKDKKATQDSFKEGWFHTGDIGVVFENDYIQLKDRLKDIIISGGENISTIEIENVLFQHPDILDAAVVGKNDKKWGEVPCAFITVKKNSSITEQEVIDFCRSNIAKFKIPKKIIFGDIKKTSTGKIKKFLLRKKANQE
ncbi:MAG TPA: acyl-CoA synthetase [Candidatus Pelagibacter sp.]|nr:acyl-CoA synthetase [Candidatus Pelagibacter sp.]